MYLYAMLNSLFVEAYPMYIMYVKPMTSSGVGAPAFRQFIEVLTFTGLILAAGIGLLAGIRKYGWKTWKKRCKATENLARKGLRVTDKRLQTNGVFYVGC